MYFFALFSRDISLIFTLDSVFRHGQLLVLSRGQDVAVWSQRCENELIVAGVKCLIDEGENSFQFVSALLFLFAFKAGAAEFVRAVEEFGARVKEYVNVCVDGCGHYDDSFFHEGQAEHEGASGDAVGRPVGGRAEFP